jgi:hypothetical protein
MPGLFFVHKLHKLTQIQKSGKVATACTVAALAHSAVKGYSATPALKQISTDL